MADYIQALSKLSVTRSGGSSAFVSTGSTTSALTGNVNVTGILTGGTVTSRLGSLTQILSSTVTTSTFNSNVGTITSILTAGTVNIGSVSAAVGNMSTLTVGTILNFSAGGSLGTNLFLTGTLTTPAATITTLFVPGSASVTGLLSNNVTGYLQARCYDDSAAYSLTAGTVGQPLPPAGLSKVVSASQTSSLNLSGASFGTLASKYSVRINGSIQAVQTGSYTFQMTYQDGLTIWIGATKLVDSWKYLAGTASSTSILTMYAGMWLPIAVEHATATSNEKLLVQWALNGSSAFSTLAHGTGFNLAYELTDTPPALLSTTYVSGQVFANDIVNMAAGASYQGAQFFSGYLSQLTNDAGYVSTLGSTITGTALMINGPYASITGTLNTGTLIAGSIGALVGSITALNAGNVRMSGSLLAAAGIAGVTSGTSNSLISLIAQSGSNLVLSFASGNGVTGSVLSIASPVGVAGNWCSDAVVGDSVMRATTGSLRLLAGSGSGSSQISLAQNNCVGINNTTPVYSLDISGQCRVSGNLSLGTTVRTDYGPGILTLGSSTNNLELAAGYGFSYGSASFVNAFGSINSIKNPLCLNAFGGNVGVNTAVPAYSLDISGQCRVTSTLLLSNTLTSTQPLIVSSPMAQAQLLLSAGTGSTYRAARIDFFSGSSTSLPQWLMINDYNQTGINDFRICASNQASVIPITCLQNGNVGINTSNPAVGLDVTGSARVSGSLTASNINSQVVTVSISGSGQGLYVSNIPCYNTTGGGAVTVTCSYNYGSGSQVAAGIYLLSQYQSTATTWSSSASTVYFLGGSNSWSFSNSNGFFAVTYPTGNNNFQFSINHV